MIKILKPVKKFSKVIGSKFNIKKIIEVGEMSVSKTLVWKPEKFDPQHTYAKCKPNKTHPDLSGGKWRKGNSWACWQSLQPKWLVPNLIKDCLKIQKVKIEEDIQHWHLAST